MVCQHCGKPALFKIADSDGTSFGLCLDCNLKYEQAQALEFDRLAQMQNFLADQTAIASGIPGLSAKIPIPRRQIIQVGGMTLNNIRVTHSNIGVLNTGSIETVDAAVTVLRNTGSDKAAEALQRLTEAVIATTETSAEEKNKILEIMSVLSAEATAPEDRRRKTAMKPLVLELSTMFSGLAGLSHLWTQYAPLITALFP